MKAIPSDDPARPADPPSFRWWARASVVAGGGPGRRSLGSGDRPRGHDRSRRRDGRGRSRPPAAWSPLLGLALVLAALAAAVLAPAIAPHDPDDQDISRRLSPPFWAGGDARFPLGTDQVGRDYLTRLIYASRVSLAVGALTVVVSGSAGVLLGLVAGYYGRRVDASIMGGVNVFMAFPFIILALAVIAVLGPSFTNLVVVMGLAGWPWYCRVVRAEVQSLRQRAFVEAARSLGADDRRILLRHVFPNALNPIIVFATLDVSRVMINEAFLSFIGLGVQPPTASWGGLLNEARHYMLTAWWLAVAPGAAIFLTTWGTNLVGEGLRDMLDPRGRQQP